MMIQKTKKAFSMVTAIFVIIIMASISSMVMNVTGKTVKATTQQYQKEQAMLLARSYTELAILYVLYYNRDSNGNCLETITDYFGPTDNGYNVTINLHYIGNNTLLNGCGTAITPWADSGTTGFNATISVMVDTYIQYHDLDDSNENNITFHRRTLQKL